VAEQLTSSVSAQLPLLAVASGRDNSLFTLRWTGPERLPLRRSFAEITAEFGEIRLRRRMPAFNPAPAGTMFPQGEVVFAPTFFNGEIEMLNPTYGTYYHRACNRMDYIVKSLAERPSRAIQLAVDAGGEQAVQALFDAVMDYGYRQVLVQSLNSAAMPQWVRERLETFLFGNRRPLAALLVKTLH
jgi:hypothetical protein